MRTSRPKYGKGFSDASGFFFIGHLFRVTVRALKQFGSEISIIWLTDASLFFFLVVFIYILVGRVAAQARNNSWVVVI